MTFRQKLVSRPIAFKILFSVEERKTLNELAVAAGLSDSDYLRQLIRQKKEERDGTRS